MASHVGLRVVRGQPWTFDKRAAGALMAGTIVAYTTDARSTSVMVQWDDNKLAEVKYPGQNHLMVLDSTPLGAVHRRRCTSCSGEICGFRWGCAECSATMCNTCYHGNIGTKFEHKHQYRRYDLPIEAGENGRQVGTRKGVSRRRVHGIFKKAEVIMAAATISGRASTITGHVAAISRDKGALYPTVVVEWSRGQVGTSYVLGYRGKVELACIKPADDHEYYLEHLPAPWELEASPLEYESVDVTNMPQYALTDRRKLGPAPAPPPPGRMEHSKGMAPPPPGTAPPVPNTTSTVSELPNIAIKFNAPPIPSSLSNQQAEYKYELAMAVKHDEEETSHEAGEEVHVIEEFISLGGDLLTLRIGDIVHRAVCVGGGYMLGEIKGQKGRFPESCVQVAYSSVDDYAMSSESEISGESFCLSSPSRATVNIAPPPRMPTNVMMVPPLEKPPQKPPREPITDSKFKDYKDDKTKTQPELKDDEDEEAEEFGDIADLDEYDKVIEIQKVVYPGKKDDDKRLHLQLSIELAEAVRKPKLTPKPKPNPKPAAGYSIVIPKVKSNKPQQDDKKFDVTTIKLDTSHKMQIPQKEPIKIAHVTSTTDAHKQHDVATPAKQSPDSKESNVRDNKVSVKAKHDYNTKQHGDLCFKKGEIISNVLVTVDNWWTGALRDKTGYFPRNYVEVIEKAKDDKEDIGEDTINIGGSTYHLASGPVTTPASSASKPSAASPNRPPSPTSDPPAPGSNNVETRPTHRAVNRSMTQYENSTISSPIMKKTSNQRPQSSYETAIPSKPIKVRMKYGFKAQTPGDLTLGINDVVTNVIRKPDGWWTGTCREKSGQFPSTYAEVLPEEPIAKQAVISPGHNFGKFKVSDKVRILVDETCFKNYQNDATRWQGDIEKVRMEGRVLSFRQNGDACVQFGRIFGVFNPDILSSCL